ncbi:barstar family protein [Nocardioides sp.]|uniref:barstar family protein n=1 Tax=Nocardioides sp. TaxID=35761 RepID=UPI0035649C90
MSGLAAILAGHLEPGVYRWDAAFEPEDVAHAVTAAGWRFGYLDGWVAGSEAEFHQGIAAALEFPDYYGANLDALWDSLGELAEPVVLLWDGWGPLARATPDRFGRILAVLRERSGAAATPFVVLMRGEGPEIGVSELR